ncbi:PAS domain S-box protein [Arthrobacter sp. I2-34]|uniref:histidine kinase n=1 Tax=Arthrobacter hankyongi TaxID=2904801 RepID=A0ABS9LCH1_9MICC|nr:PAS domain S-box protein [Arthrobacter hankyongi]MCG2624360.1 PAS domain S-box protein [Arthrobacter hankyongi]
MDAISFQPSDGDFGAMLAALRHCILIHDAESKDILWANPAACEMLGFTLEELRPLKAPDMSSSERRYRRSVGRQWLQNAVEHGTSRTEWMYRTKAGVDFLTEAIATRVRLSERTVVMVQFRDIEKEDALKSDLQRTESRLRAFTDSMREALLVVADDGVVSYASHSAESQLGISLGELLGSRLADFCTDDSKPALEQALSVTGTSPRSSSFRLALRRDDGSDNWFAVNPHRIDLQDDLRGTLLFLHDITDRIRFEKEHQHDQDRLNYLARQNVMGDLAMALAHELGQPLTAATNFITGAKRRLDAAGDVPEGLAYGLDNAQKQIERANQILRSLKGFVGTLETSEQVVDLNKIVRDCLYFIDLTAEAHQTSVKVNLHEAPIPIRCEMVLIGQVVMNLCRNAVEEMARFPQQEREVTIETRPVDGFGEFSVSDRGRGLAHFPDGRIFDGAFTTKVGGSGVGLALSHRIITRQRGTITAMENHPGGSIFRFRLPQAATAEVSQ